MNEFDMQNSNKQSDEINASESNSADAFNEELKTAESSETSEAASQLDSEPLQSSNAAPKQPAYEQPAAPPHYQPQQTQQGSFSSWQANAQNVQSNPNGQQSYMQNAQHTQGSYNGQSGNIPPRQDSPQHTYPYQSQTPSQGYYRPQTNEYIYAPQAPKKKKNVGKAVLIAIVTVLSVFVISVASISAYSYIQYSKIDRDSNSGSDSMRSDVPMDEHEFKNEADNENVYSDDAVAANKNNVVSENDNGELSESNRTQLRDFPTIEQLATPDDAMTIPDIYNKVIPSVVGISCKVAQGTQLGTGFIISDEGYIITNAHVIDGYQSVMVVDGELNEYDAEVIGADTQTDIAVLKIDPSDMDLVPVEFGKSGDLRIGEIAIAIGNPLGFDLYGTITTGIISGLNRSVTIEDNTMTLLQTSASINSGNSGGPLINAYGQVIGITSAKIDSIYGESLGFAIPIDEALPIVEDLIKYGYVVGRPSIGISGKDITEILSIYLGVPRGVYVSSVVDGSGAQAAGIRPDDVIIGINGQTITNMNELNEVKNQFSVGDTVTLTIYRTSVSDWGSRNGESFDVDVVLTEASPDPQG